VYVSTLLFSVTDARRASTRRRISFTPARASVVSAIAYGVNVATVSLPGRIDGEMQKRARAREQAAVKDADAGDAKRAAAAKESAKVHAIPLDSEYRSLFTPAGWAFAIWGAIYAGEAAFAAHALASPDAAVRDVAPWWTLACGLQGLWCLAFRPWASKPRHFWVSSALLVAEAAVLGVAHRALRAAVTTMSAARYWTTHVPLSMHFGWISCASLVNMNSFVAKTCALDTQLAVAFLSSFGAAALGCAVTLRTGDPVYACVIAWALSAVASDGGKRTSETLGDTPLKALAKSARWSARIALAGVVASRVIASLSA